MQLTHSLLLIIAATVTSTFASNCEPGYNYCGHTLLTIGEYLAQMRQESHDCFSRVGNKYCDSDPPSGAELDYLYKCVNEGDRAGPGVIEFIEDCAHGNEWYCSNNGNGNNDSCKQDS